MTPTNELRFVERQITEPIPNEPNLGVRKNVRILQQKWEHEPRYSPYSGLKPETVWRDVPVVKEQV